jgi:hypothetical protein
MGEQQLVQNGPRRGVDLWKGAAVVLCLFVAAALCHANFVGCHTYMSHEDRGFVRGTVSCIGWPVIYGTTEDGKDWDENRWHSSKSTTHYLLLDAFTAMVLVGATAMVFWLWRTRHDRRWQFTLSDLFSLTTAVAVLFAVLASERTYGWNSLGYSAEDGVYSALSEHPWYDQVPIGIGIVCAVHLMLAALCQLLRLSARKQSRVG